MLVCTHGRKDRCCAKFGFAAYKALRARAGEAGPEVWESTHLGGCRLAGSALALPGLHKYGRLRPSDASALLADEAEGRPWLPGWRGPSHREPEAQAVAHAAETWARAWARGGRATGDPKAAPDGWSVAVDTVHGAVILHARTTSRRHTRPGTCDDLDAREMGSSTSWGVVLRSVKP